MATDVQNSATQAAGNITEAASTVGQIIRDAQELLSQQLALFRAEVREDLRKTREAAYPMLIGIALAFVGGILLFLMLVHLIHATWPERVPLWGAYGIVAAVTLVAGAALFFAGKKRFDSFNPLPDQTAQAAKENLQWLTHPK